MAGCGCQQCQGSGTTGGGCATCLGANRNQVEFPLIAQRTPNSLVPLGSTYSIPMNAIPKAPNGWHRHISRIRVIAPDAQWNTTAAGMTAALSGYQLLGVAKFSLRDDCNHEYMNNLDGRAVRDDSVMLNFEQLVADPTDLPDADNTGISRALYWDILTSRINADGTVEPDGLIPAAVLMRADALQISVQAQVPGAPAGVTFTGFIGTANAVLVIVTCVDLPALAEGRKWSVDNYSLATANGQLQFPDRGTDYAALRYWPEETGGQSLADFTDLQADVNGVVVFDANSTTEIGLLNAAIYEADPDATAALFGATVATQTFAMLVARQAKWPAGARGPITYQSTRSTHTNMRFLHRTWRCMTDGQAACAVNSACLPSGSPGVARMPGGWDKPSNAPDAPRFFSPPARAGIAQREVDQLI